MERSKVSVLLVSVDTLKPESIFEQERLGISLPNISKYFVENGTFAGGGVQSVLPTFTYPCHQSIITRTNPATHGIYNSGIFDPMGEHMGAWHWFASKKAENLREAAGKYGYLSANVAFPTSVAAGGDFMAPELWWDGTELDSRFIDAMSVPQGMILEMEKGIGGYAGGLNLAEVGDRQRYRAAMWVLDHKLTPKAGKHPFFMTVYSVSFDEMAHQYGVYSKEAVHAIEAIDKMLGDLVEKVYNMTDGQAVVCVVSDRGTLDNRYNIRPNVKLREAGLITIDGSGRVTDWKAWSQRAGGTSEIRLKGGQDEDARRKLDQIMKELLSDPVFGILEVLDRAQAIERGGFPLADYVLVSRKGYEVRDGAGGDYHTETLHQKARHGYCGRFEEMRASFMTEGCGIERKCDIGSVNLIDIVPTLASVVGLDMPQAEGRSRLK